MILLVENQTISLTFRVNVRVGGSTCFTSQLLILGIFCDHNRDMYVGTYDGANILGFHLSYLQA